MDRFRCPTCLTLLEGDEQRCPACRSKLRKRGQPIVLGENARISSRPPLPFERDMQAAVASRAPGQSWRYGRMPAAERAAAAPAPAPAPSCSSGIASPPREETLEALLAFEPVTSTAVEPSFEPEPMSEPASELATASDVTIEPEPTTAIEAERAPVMPAVEPLRPVVDLFAVARFEWPEDTPPEPAPPVDIDLVEEERAEARREVVVEREPPAPAIRPLTSLPTEIARLPRVGGELHDIFEALHRKARAEVSDDVPSTARGSSDTSPSLPESPRAVRPAVPRSPRRRRWMVEFQRAADRIPIRVREHGAGVSVADFLLSGSYASLIR